MISELPYIHRLKSVVLRQRMINFHRIEFIKQLNTAKNNETPINENKIIIAVSLPLGDRLPLNLKSKFNLLLNNWF